MLAIFPKHVAEGPSELRSAESSCTSGAGMVGAFKDANADAVCMQFDAQTAICYTHGRESFVCPRQFASSDDVFCLFAGNLENLPQLRQIYGLSRNVCESQLVIEAYKTLRDRGPYTADQVISDLKGSFTFVLYDNKCKKLFIAADHVGKVPLYWGTCQDGVLVISDNSAIIKAGCGKSFAPFPTGCFFSSMEGLSCYVHPTSALKPIPHVDSQGQVCGANFEVEQKGSKMSESGKDWLNSF